MLAGSGSEPAAGPRHADRQREHHHRNNRIKHAPRVGPLHLRSKQARAVTEREEKDEAGRRNAEIETAPLIARLGPMFPVPELGSRMRCTSCEARDVATRPAWPRHGGGQIARYG